MSRAIDDHKVNADWLLALYKATIIHPARHSGLAYSYASYKTSLLVDAASFPHSVQRKRMWNSRCGYVPFSHSWNDFGMAVRRGSLPRHAFKFTHFTKRKTWRSFKGVDAAIKCGQISVQCRSVTCSNLRYRAWHSDDHMIKQIAPLSFNATRPCKAILHTRTRILAPGTLHQSSFGYGRDSSVTFEGLIYATKYLTEH